jgi:class 3 adenylate cyclase
LQGDVVKLVNEVAAIVHGAVIENLGAPNKNIGDAFLVPFQTKAIFKL